MTVGTIHALTAGLFLIEGSSSTPPRVVYRAAAGLYLMSLDAGSLMEQPAQAAAVNALLSSYPEIERPLVVGVAPGGQPVGTAELLMNADIRIGSTSWSGWTVGDEDVLLLHTSDVAGRVAVYVPDHGLVVLDALTLHLVQSELTLRSRLLAMIDSGHLRLLSAGAANHFLLDRRAARRLLGDGASRVSAGLT